MPENGFGLGDHCDYGRLEFHGQNLVGESSNLRCAILGGIFTHNKRDRKVSLGAGRDAFNLFKGF
jgi:hypothetical protein